MSYDEINDQLKKELEATRAREQKLIKQCEELQEAVLLADKSNAAKTQFLINMSHEIRTPVNGISGITELLYNTSVNDEQRSYLDMLKASSVVLTDIVGNILDMTAIEAGKIRLNEEVFDIKENVESIVNQLSITGYKKKLKIMYYIEPFTETVIKGDRLKLNQVLINLVNNSIKYTNQGHVFISVNKLSEKNDKVRYQFSVEDTGSGIDDSIKDNVFRAYDNVDLSYAKKYAGAGLGLAISRRLVDMMNGEIWFESEKDKGSTFYFTAEFSHANMTRANAPKVNHSMEAIERQGEVPLILVVEDNEINKKLAAAFLSKKGYEIVCASNGLEAVEAYKKYNVNLILMDIQMPELNGFEATKIIRDLEKDNGKRVPIITMTAYAMTGDREKCLAAGMDDYISKPISAEILYEKVNKFLKFEK